MQLHPTKVLKCKVCNDDVIFNANYPITEITCAKCYSHSREQTIHNKPS